MHVITRKNKKGERRYSANIRLNGHSLTQTFLEKRQADEWLKRVSIAIRDEVARGIPFVREDWLPKKKAPKPSAKAIEQQQAIINATPSTDWLLSRAIKEYMVTELENLKGFKQAENRLKAWLKHPFANLKLNELTPHMLAQHVRELEKSGKSASTIRNNIFRISAIYELAKKPLTKHGWGLDIENPVKEIALPSLAGGRQRRLRKGEEDKLLQAISEGMYAEELLPFIILAIETGMRKSEILGIQHKEIHITDSGWNITKHDTKNGQRRTIFLSNRAKDAIQPIFEKIKYESPDTELWQTLTSNNVENWFIRAKDKAGLPDLRLHDLRHEAISRLADKGLSVGSIANQSGHRSMQTLLRYVNAKESDIRDKLEK